LRVLVVGKHAETADRLAQTLMRFGHMTFTVRAGHSVPDLAWFCKADVVILELDLPEVNGLEVGRELVSSRPSKTPLVIAISGAGSQAAREHSATIGIDLHLVKPVDPEDLEAVLRRFQGVLGDGELDYGQRA